MAGYIHHHTAFKFPERCQTPGELRREVENLGGDFVFCAGDHGRESEALCYLGWYEGKNYYEHTLSANTGNGVFLIPTGEYHLYFPDEVIRGGAAAPFWEARKKWPGYKPFLHTFIPMLEWTDDICLHVREKTSPLLLDAAEKKRIALPLLHPGLCHLSGHPDPTDFPWLGRMSYIEMFNEMAHFKYDYLLYKYYLSGNLSRKMGIFSGVDFTDILYTLSSPENIKAENVTYLYVSGKRTIENLFKSWNQRRAVAVRGRLFPEYIEPAPSVEDYAISGVPEIQFGVRSFGKGKIRYISILRNGTQVFAKFCPARDAIELKWRDSQFKGKEASYTIIIEADGDWMITSPINFIHERSAAGNEPGLQLPVCR